MSKHKHARLSDDGTMDTVIECAECGVEARFTFDGRQVWNGTSDEPKDDYQAFIETCLDDFEDEHECTCSGNEDQDEFARDLADRIRNDE